MLHRHALERRALSWRGLLLDSGRRVQIRVDITSLVRGLFAAAAVMISFGGACQMLPSCRHQVLMPDDYLEARVGGVDSGLPQGLAPEVWGFCCNAFCWRCAAILGRATSRQLMIMAFLEVRPLPSDSGPSSRSHARGGHDAQRSAQKCNAAGAHRESLCGRAHPAQS